MNLRRWNDLPLRRKGLAVIAIPLLPLLLSAVLVAANARRTRDAQGWVVHTLQAKAQIGSLINALADEETGVRGFLLTHDRSALDLYESGKTAYEPALAMLRKTVADNPLQLEHLQTFDRLAAGRHLDSLLAYGRAHPAGEVPVDGLRQSRAALTAMRGELAAMEQIEDGLLSSRVAVAQRVEQQLVAIAWIGALFGLAGGVLAAGAFTTGIAGRLERVRVNADRLAHGEPVDPLPPASDEVGQLALSLTSAGTLLAERVEDLQRAQDELGRFFTVSLNLLCIADLKGRLLRVNPAWEQVLGWSAEELTSVPYANFVHPEDLEATVHEAEALAAGATTIQFENRYRCKDGSYKWLNWHVAPAPERGLLYAAAHDVTERKRTADELRARVADLAAVNRELEAFSYSVSHDLRAPLRHVTGFAALLDRHAGSSLDETGRRYIATMKDAAGRMGRLIDDLLAFSRMGRTAVAKRAVSLSEVVTAARSEVITGLVNRPIEWTVHPLPTVQGDPALLHLAMVNLLSNAVKYTRGRTPALIEVGSECSRQGETVLFVRDNGVGFDMQYVDKLFGVFQRLHNNEDFDGTGIGLANVRRIIHRHGGRTWAEGRPNTGATFYVALPTGA